MSTDRPITLPAISDLVRASGSLASLGLRYLRCTALSTGAMGHYFEPAGDDLKVPGCPVRRTKLGTAPDAALEHYQRLIARYDAWKETRGLVEEAEPTQPRNDLRGLVAYYEANEKFADVEPIGRRNLANLLRRAVEFRLDDGRVMGDIPLADLDDEVVAAFETQLLRSIQGKAKRSGVWARKPLPANFDPVEDDGDESRPVDNYGRTTRERVVRVLARAWAVAVANKRHGVPSYNPFARRKLGRTGLNVPAATAADLVAFVCGADKDGHESLGTAAMMMFCLFQREEDVLGRFLVKHYRPDHRPDEIEIVDNKNETRVWIPLFGPDGSDLFPALRQRLDALKGSRRGGRMIVRRFDTKRETRGTGLWMPSHREYGNARHVASEILRKAGLTHITLRSFRHGGMTESGNAGATVFEIASLSGHKTLEVLTRYVKRSRQQIYNLVDKRQRAATLALPAHPADVEAKLLAAMGPPAGTGALASHA